MSSAEGDRLHLVESSDISPERRRLGKAVLWAATAAFVLIAALQIFEVYDPEGEPTFANWRPTLYAYITWGVALCVYQVLTRGEAGLKTLFVLPAALFTVAVVLFPLGFGVSIALSDWNLSSFEGREFNGFDNFVTMWNDPFYWNALENMIYYVLVVLVEYGIAFGLALLLNAQIRARRFFRVVFLIPLMLSPVAVSWMIGKSLLQAQFGPITRLARDLGWSQPAWFTDPLIAKTTMMVLDAWTWIPLMMVILLAGLQSLSKEVLEAADVDGASPWQRFWRVVFPLMIPVSVTAMVIRIIFKLKLADIVITVTSGGPGGATDTVSSFIFREYRDRSNVGYGTLLAFVYLIVIVIFITVLLQLLQRAVKRVT